MRNISLIRFCFRKANYILRSPWSVSCWLYRHLLFNFAASGLGLAGFIATFLSILLPQVWVLLAVSSPSQFCCLGSGSCWLYRQFFFNFVDSCSVLAGYIANSSILLPIMDCRDDSAVYADKDLSEELFWSESDDEDYNSTPVCIGCNCQEWTCEHLMPLNGTVLWGSTEWDVKDYIDLNVRLLTIGVRLYYQCSRCLGCDCLTSQVS